MASVASADTAEPGPPPRLTKAASLQELKPEDFASFAAHRCVFTRENLCLSAFTPAQLRAVRAVTRDPRLDEQGRSEVLAVLVADHVHGVADFRLLGHRVCRDALLAVSSFSSEKLDRVVRERADVAGAGGAANGEGWGRRGGGVME